MIVMVPFLVVVVVDAVEAESTTLEASELDMIVMETVPAD